VEGVELEGSRGGVERLWHVEVKEGRASRGGGGRGAEAAGNGSRESRSGSRDGISGRGHGEAGHGVDRTCA
jgi:hypothetical protein